MEKCFLVMSEDARRMAEKNRWLISYIRKHIRETESATTAEKIMVLGGDGTMLKAIRDYHNLHIPFCGLNYGHFGALMSEATTEKVKQIVHGDVKETKDNLLKAQLYGPDNEILKTEFAFNDFRFERSDINTAKIYVRVNDVDIFDGPLTCDGVIVASAAGSTAYTAAARGMIAYLGMDCMILTGICPALFHHWQTSTLPVGSLVKLRPIETDFRPVRFVCDNVEIAGVTKALICRSREQVALQFAESEDNELKRLNIQLGRI